MRYYAVADCREGRAFGWDERGPYWEDRFIPVTFSAHRTEHEALAAARAVVDASPHHTRNPRVEER